MIQFVHFGLLTFQPALEDNNIFLSHEIVRQLGNFWYILIPEIINKFMTNMSDPVRAEHVHVFKLKLK
jgi:hypothetical protein